LEDTIVVERAHEACVGQKDAELTTRARRSRTRFGVQAVSEEAVRWLESNPSSLARIQIAAFIRVPLHSVTRWLMLVN
jgi:hypothetical protein